MFIFLKDAIVRTEMKDISQENIAYLKLKNRVEKYFEYSDENNQKVKFLPYIGEKYFDADFKILVVGESHYNGKKENDHNRELTIDEFANSYLNIGNKDKNGYYYQFDSFSQYPLNQKNSNGGWLGKRRTAEFIVGAENNSHKSDYVWDYLAFYNFYQRLVGCCSSCDKWYSKDKESFHKEAKEALPIVIKKLKPNLIVVWENGRFREADLSCQNKNGREYFEGVEVFRINHPARSLIRDEFVSKWRQNGFLEKTRKFDSYENISTKLKDIENEIVKDVKVGFELVRGRCYLSFELYISKKDGKPVKSLNNFVCDIILNDEDYMVRFYTRNYSKEESVILLTKMQKKFIVCDEWGRCTLYKSSTLDENFMSELKEFLKSLVVYRKKIWDSQE